ncbi:hypothetical protein EJ06DRAFT_27664 [Trichodelitschia bisporula]|uniref:Uncharacterized protein n=1 Tax=Trichodelitschia bisporula TaxID=703511 RepID=A0A6G1IB14_9PEZI|nr:hypothetical protein EJ06DRAFT_27664 [Trichodelitschia bisporula]
MRNTFRLACSPDAPPQILVLRRAKPTLPDDGHSGKTRMPTPQSLLMVAAANVQARLEELDQRILDEKNMTPPAALRGWSTFVRHAQFPQQRWPTRSKKLTKGVNEGGHTEVGWIEADSVRSSLQDVENIAPEGEAQESLKLARPSVNRHGQEAQMREIRVDKRHNALKKQVRHVQASRTVRRGVGTDDGGGGVTILSSKEPPRTKPPSQRVTKPHRTPSQASCDSEPLPLQKPDLRASVADIEMAAHPTIPPPPSGSTSRVRSWGPTSFHNLVPPGEAQGAPTKPESKGLKSIFHKLRRARKTRSEAHIGDKIQFNYEPPNEGAQTSVDHAEVTEMSLPVSQRNSTIRQDSPDEYHSAVSTVSSNSPELPEERGRSLNRISVLSGNSGKTNEVEEARDKFDDRLVPPLTFTSKKAESPGRDSKFHEVFEEPELEVRWKGVDSATRSEASR